MLYLFVNVQVNCRQQEGAESIKFKNNSTKKFTDSVTMEEIAASSTKPHKPYFKFRLYTIS